MSSFNSPQIALTWTVKGQPDWFIVDEKPRRLGRGSDCDLVLRDTSVSRVHAQIYFENGRHYIEDMGSKFGTLVDEHPLKQGEPMPLMAGCEIQLGKQILWCETIGPGSNRSSVSPLSLTFYGKQLREELLDFDARFTTLLDRTITDRKELASIKLLLADELNYLNSNLSKKFNEHLVLQEITLIIGQILDLPQLLSTVLKLASRVLDADRGIVLLYHPEEDCLKPVAGRRFDQVVHATSQVEVTFSKTIARSCFEQRKVVRVDDVKLDQRFAAAESIIAASIRSAVCIPLIQREEVLGVIYLDNLHRTNCFPEYQENFLTTFAAQTTNALQNARLYSEAVTDDLTGLYNRKFIETRLEEELERIARFGGCCSLIMLDLDQFKRVNDTHGHQAGDRVLIHTASALRAAVRHSDWVGRFGGEEFLLILPETPAAGVLEFAERLRQAIQNTQIDLGRKRLSITASFGVITVDGSTNEDMPTLLAQVDELLYRAKNAGRNRVVGGEFKPKSDETGPMAIGGPP